MSEYGVFIYDTEWRRPKSKREIKDTLPELITLEGVSPFDSRIPDGSIVKLAKVPLGSYNFVGPDPYTSRKFYGTIVIAENGQIYVR